MNDCRSESWMNERDDPPGRADRSGMAVLLLALATGCRHEMWMAVRVERCFNAGEVGAYIAGSGSWG